MDNLHLFELLNAGPGLDPTRLLVAELLAEQLAWVVPVGLAGAWMLGSADDRHELAHVLLVAGFTIVLVGLGSWLWPVPTPASEHMGTQYLPVHDGLLDDQVAVLWGVALALLAGRRHAVWAFPVFSIGVVSAIARVYLGSRFPISFVSSLAEAAMAAVAGLLAVTACRRGHRPAGSNSHPT